MDKKNIIYFIKRAGVLVLMAFFIASATSCSKDDEPERPDPQPPKYTIKGQVMNQATNTPLSGVLVTMGTLTKTTNATGQFEFSNLTEAGKYTMVFTKDDFFSATYSIEFQEGGPNFVLVYTITVTMVPYVEGVTPINPSEGGSIDISGSSLPASLTIPANTTITDKDDNPVTGTVNISAIAVPDFVASGNVNNPGLAVMQFGPSGLQFSNPLPLVINNPLTSNRFKNIQLEYYNQTSGQWEIKPQSVDYLSSNNKYTTTINHFSIYKVTYVSQRTPLVAGEEVVDVVDNVIHNNSVQSITVNSIAIKRKQGYKFGTPLATVISNAGITGADASTLKAMIENLVKPYFGNSNSVDEFALVDDNISVNRVILPDWKLYTTGKQIIEKNRFSVVITKGDGTDVTLNIEVHSAGSVTLFFEDKHETHGDHGSGGGGSI